MPSLQHTVVATVIRRLRREFPAEDLGALRAHLVQVNRASVERPPAGVRRGRDERIENNHGFPVVQLWPGGADAPRRAVLYVHGGAYCKPAHPRQWQFAARLSDALGARTVFPLYPLAPSSTVADSFAALADLYEEVAAQCPDGVVLAGDSAGGGYVLALAQEIRDRSRLRDIPPPERLVLISPWVDLTSTSPGTAEAAERDPWLSLDHLLPYAGFWAGSEDPKALADWRVSPLHGDLTDLPPTLMLCGTRDLLHPSCDALFDRAEQAQWDLTYVVGPGLIHVYPLLPVPEATAAFSTIVEFCSRD